MPTRHQTLQLMNIAIGGYMHMFDFKIVVRSQNKSWKEMRDEASI